MLNLDERFLIGMKAIQRLRSNSNLGLSLQRTRFNNRSTQIKTGFQIPANSPTASAGAQPAPWAGLKDPREIENELLQAGTLKPYSALLGICEDGLPFILDFTNPAPGSFLIGGDEGSGKGLLMSSVLASAIRLNQPGNMTFHLVAQDQDRYSSVTETAHCQNHITFDDPRLSEVIDSLTEAIETRKRNGPQDPAILLVIDDLAGLIAALEPKTLSRFYGLIKHGPRYRIWIIAGLAAHDAPIVEPQILQAFRTHLICGIKNRKLAQLLSDDHGLNSRDLAYGDQFFVPYGDQWLRSWICQPMVYINEEDEP